MIMEHSKIQLGWAKKNFFCPVMIVYYEPAAFRWNNKGISQTDLKQMKQDCKVIFVKNTYDFKSTTERQMKFS